MDIPYLLSHPEELNQETLYDLRKVVAVYPTYHAARILFLQNLFLMHDPTFDQELRRAALLVPDRRVLFNITQTTGKPEAEEKTVEPEPTGDATTRMLADFLDNVPPPQANKRIKADPSTDYMAFLMQQEEEEKTTVTAAPTAEDRQDSLMLNFIASQSAGITLSENPMVPEGILDDPDEIEEDTELAYEETEQSSGELSETLAQIYIKQQKYDRAIEVMTKIHNTPSAKNNPYYADQVRFLQKLALNDRYKSRKQNQ